MKSGVLSHCSPLYPPALLVSENTVDFLYIEIVSVLASSTPAPLQIAGSDPPWLRPPSMRRSGPVRSPEPEPAVPTGDLGQMQRGPSGPWQTSVGSTHDQFWQMEGLCDTASIPTPVIPFPGAGRKSLWWNPMTASFYLPREGTYLPPTYTRHKEQAWFPNKGVLSKILAEITYFHSRWIQKGCSNLMHSAWWERP